MVEKCLARYCQRWFNLREEGYTKRLPHVPIKGTLHIYEVVYSMDRYGEKKGYIGRELEEGVDYKISGHQDLIIFHNSLPDNIDYCLTFDYMSFSFKV